MQAKRIDESIVEIVSDSGEGAQKAGQAFGALCARMGNGVWTVEIIPAEIKPPKRSSAGASGIRIRFGSKNITNSGNEADLVFAFNEQVLYGRIDQSAYRPGTVILLENKWATDAVPQVREAYAAALQRFKELQFDVREIALDDGFRAVSSRPVGKNMFVLGMLCHMYQRRVELALDEVAALFGRKGEKIVKSNQELVKAGYRFAAEHLDICYEVPPWEQEGELVVMNGNQALGLGVMASGMELVSMYPITPATSASHYLAGSFHKMGGVVHQAEDEIAAIGFAIGASFAGKTACTITSGPGLALKTEFLGLAVMAEIPLVIGLVQRGGPSTGLPTKVEQGDLLAAMYGATGDAPKIIVAPATIQECLQFMVTARQLAETFRGPVIVLTDTNLATGVQPFPKPHVTTDWFAAPLDQQPWKEGLAPYDWDKETGLSARPVPGQAGGEYTLTGLAHTEHSKVAYDPDSNQRSSEMRSKKLQTLRKTLKPPEIYGDPDGDLLIIGWGSTMGAIQEAVDAARADGIKVSAIQLRFISPLEPGIEDIMKRFKKVFTVEINYSDPEPTPGEERRLAQLAIILRSATLVDVDCWSNVHGQPIRPASIHDEIIRRAGRL